MYGEHSCITFPPKNEPINLKDWKDFIYWDTSFTFASLEKRQK